MTALMGSGNGFVAAEEKNVRASLFQADGRRLDQGGCGCVSVGEVDMRMCVGVRGNGGVERLILDGMVSVEWRGCNNGAKIGYSGDAD